MIHPALGLATALATSLAFTLPAHAVQPTHYNMPNGYGTANGGSYNYWDASYNGAGNPRQDFAWLSGGAGDLIDGVIANDNWHLVESLAGDGPYVGWSDLDPVINFHFAAPLQLRSITVHHDDANGYGNVAAPAKVVVTVDDRSFTALLADAPGAAPGSVRIELPNAPLASMATVQVFRRDTAVFVSEVQFEAVTAVPEPGTYALMLAGLGGMLLATRRRIKPAPAR